MAQQRMMAGTSGKIAPKVRSSASQQGYMTVGGRRVSGEEAGRIGRSLSASKKAGAAQEDMYKKAGMRKVDLGNGQFFYEHPDAPGSGKQYANAAEYRADSANRSGVKAWMEANGGLPGSAFGAPGSQRQAQQQQTQAPAPQQAASQSGQKPPAQMAIPPINGGLQYGMPSPNMSAPWAAMPGYDSSSIESVFNNVYAPAGGYYPPGYPMGGYQQQSAAQVPPGFGNYNQQLTSLDRMSGQGKGGIGSLSQTAAGKGGSGTPGKGGSGAPPAAPAAVQAAPAAPFKRTGSYVPYGG